MDLSRDCQDGGHHHETEREDEWKWTHCDRVRPKPVQESGNRIVSNRRCNHSRDDNDYQETTIHDLGEVRELRQDRPIVTAIFLKYEGSPKEDFQGTGLSFLGLLSLFTIIEVIIFGLSRLARNSF